MRRSTAGVRESQGLPRIMDTLTVAMEYINMPAPEEQMVALETLRKDTLRCITKKPWTWRRLGRCRCKTTGGCKIDLGCARIVNTVYVD